MEFKYLTYEKEDVIKLINEIFNKNFNSDFILMDNQKVLLLKGNDKVIGTTLITEKYDPFKKCKTYYLDYLCIRREYEHKGLGTLLLKKVLEIAKDNNIDFIELTSNKNRERARKMYLKFGMKIRDTDIFVKETNNENI